MKENRESLKFEYTSENKLTSVQQKIQKPLRHLRYVYNSYHICMIIRLVKKIFLP